MHYTNLYDYLYRLYFPFKLAGLSETLINTFLSILITPPTNSGKKDKETPYLFYIFSSLCHVLLQVYVYSLVLLFGFNNFRCHNIKFVIWFYGSYDDDAHLNRPTHLRVNLHA